MTDDGPSIAELKQATQAMTPKPWRCNEPNLSIDGDLEHRDGPVMLAEFTGETMMADGPGIVALRNAAPLLLEIAAAALDFAFIQETRHPTEFAQEQFDVLWAALAKVRP